MGVGMDRKMDLILMSTKTIK